MLLDFVQAPFRMQPGLRRLPDDASQLTPLATGSALWKEKKSVVEAGASRHCAPGFDPALAIDSIAEKSVLERCSGRLDPQSPLELAFEEDFALLDGADSTLPWLCVCVPSHWAPEEKVGLPLAAVHAPVADNATLLAATQQLVALVTSGGCWERFVWTITPSPRYDQHPTRHAREPWPAASDAAAFASGCYLRAERQTFFPVEHGTRQAVFTIRVMLEPLREAVDTPAKADRLHDSLASMSQAVLDYKGLSPARPRLLEWLGMEASH